MHIVLLVADGYCPTYISRVLSCSHTTVHALTRHFLREDRADFYDRQKRGPRRALLDYSAQKRIETLVEGHSPVERGWLRCAGAVLLVRCWHPEREIVAVADGTYASLKLLDRCRGLSNPITFITRLRLDAALYEPAPPPRRLSQMERPRLKGERLPNLSALAEDPHSTDYWTPIRSRSSPGL